MLFLQKEDEKLTLTSKHVKVFYKLWNKEYEPNRRSGCLLIFHLNVNKECIAQKLQVSCCLYQLSKATYID